MNDVGPGPNPVLVRLRLRVLIYFTLFLLYLFPYQIPLPSLLHYSIIVVSAFASYYSTWEMKRQTFEKRYGACENTCCMLWSAGCTCSVTPSLNIKVI